MSLIDKEIWYDWGGANDAIFSWVNSISGDIYDKAMLLLSSIGDHHNFYYYITILAVVALLFYFVRKLSGRGGAPYLLAGWFGALIVLVASYGAEGVILPAAKNYFAYPRPYMAATYEVRMLERKPSEDDYRSFPSGHAAFITMMVVGLWPVLSKNMKIFGVLLIFGVCWSRLALGMHFPVDVLAGFLLSLVLVIIMRKIIYWILLRLFKLKC